MFHEIKTFVVDERLEKIIYDITYDFPSTNSIYWRILWKAATEEERLFGM